MKLYLQFGYGMMDHCRELLTSWKGGTVILSPRDLTPHRLPGFARELIQIGSTEVLVDPQFYLPNSDHKRLCSHDYWPGDYESQLFWQGAPLNDLLKKIYNLNSSCGSRTVILPGMLASRIDDDWIASQKAILDEAIALNTNIPVLCTVALSSDATRDQAQIGTLLEAAEHWNPSGYYLVCEHPGDYLVEDPNWLANVLDIVSGLRILGKEVILGYANHQMLVAGAANASAICSGTWMNVRSFPPQKFQATFDDEIKKRSKWYYCPKSLSEYKLTFLDIALRQGVLTHMTPANHLDGGYVGMLFSGAQPSTTDFSEQSAFRHYLHALHEQVQTVKLASFDDTVTSLLPALDEAEELLGTLSKAGVSGQKRDFSDIVDVNRAALSALSSTRGAMLRRRWSSL